MNFIFDPSLMLYLPLYQLDGSSFISRDVHGHLCTVTGALWRPNGRNFDGSDDYIEIPATSTQLDFTSEDFTIFMWVKFSDVSSSHILFLRSDFSTTGYYAIVRSTASIRFYTLQAGPTSQTSATSASEVTTGVWYNLVFVRDGTSVKIYKDTVDRTTSSGTHIDPDTDAGVTRIGIRRDNANDFAGTIGEVWVYNRALTPVEIQRNYLATKWRYQ